MAKRHPNRLLSCCDRRAIKNRNSTAAKARSIINPNTYVPCPRGTIKFHTLSQWGSEGNGDGEFSKPQGLAIDSDGDVYVSDQGNHRILVFKPTV